MRLTAGAFFIVMAGVSQVTVASLFPLRGAVVECGLLTVLLLALAAGPRAAMFGLPLAALAVGFASDRAPGLLILAYLPVLPLAAYVEEARLPFARYLQLLAVAVVCGVWARAIMATGPISQGADVGPVVFLRDLVLPGIGLDVLAFTAMYLPIRIIGRGTASLTLQRGRYAL